MPLDISGFFGCILTGRLLISCKPRRMLNISSSSVSTVRLFENRFWRTDKSEVELNLDSKALAMDKGVSLDSLQPKSY